MTLDTQVYVHDEIDPHEVFHKVRALLGATDAHPYTDSDSDIYGCRIIGNEIGIGLPALMHVAYRDGIPLRATDDGHDKWCDEDCSGTWHKRAAWLEVDLDTGYGYSDAHGGCGSLHARLVARLGAWLDARGVRWSWQNEFTGETFGGEDRYARLIDLVDSGRDAHTWFTSFVEPAIQKEIAARAS
jgi:hypothetical protein